MKCPYCGHAENKVVDKRESEDLEVTRRRRECLSCEKRFTTYERVEILELTVIKKNGDREAYDRTKVLRGIRRACEKRPVSEDQITKVVDEVEQEIRTMDTKEVQSKAIGELVMNKLRDVDKISYIRFASVYREFKDTEEFMKEIKQLFRGTK
jgi:transcriptional repressor NrdR